MTAPFAVLNSGEGNDIGHGEAYGFGNNNASTSVFLNRKSSVAPNILMEHRRADGTDNFGLGTPWSRWKYTYLI
jgi:hypothetical protein